jgi:ABC-type sugar transport system substrate-binding protein
VIRNFLALLLIATCAGCGNSSSGGPPGVVLLRYNPGSESTTQREEGFLKELKEKFPEINVLSSDQYSGTTGESSVVKATQIIKKYGDRIEGIFAVCEPNANGTLRALENADMAKHVILVGFDPNDKMVLAMREGKIHSIVLQDPVKMGYLAVKTLVAHLNGQPVEKRISTGEYLATPENMDTDEMKRLLNPPKFSGAANVPANPKYRIAVIPKGTTHDFWLSVHYGAQQAADELGNVEILWLGPQNEGNVSDQIKITQSFAAKGVHGICLAPNDSQSLVGAVREAKEKGIPTVIYDSGLDAEPDLYVSYVATDNFVGGQLAGKRMGELLTAKKPAE